MDWWLTKDGDAACLGLYEKHYSAHRYRDGRVRKLFCGPGDKVPLRTFSGDAFFVWRKFRDQCIDVRTGKPQAGINCAAFRNEGTCQSSWLIRQADAIADCLWADRRHYTYVDASKVASRNPGYCFLCAGWRRCGVTKSGLLILERVKEAAMEEHDAAANDMAAEGGSQPAEEVNSASTEETLPEGEAPTEGSATE